MESKHNVNRMPLIRLKPILQIEQNIKTKLFPHQEQFLKKALRWEQKGHGGLLGAEMGTGKTLMVLSLYAKNVDKITGEPKRTIVIAPVSLLQNWRNEYLKHLNLPISKVAIYHGAKREQMSLKDRHMVITSYETLRLDIERNSMLCKLIVEFKPERIILDEAHEIKNQKSHRFHAVLELPSRLCWAITGTPILNYQKDLESLTAFIGLAPYSAKDWWADHKTAKDFAQWKEDSYIHYSKSEINLKLPERHYFHHQLEFSDEENEIYTKMKIEAKNLFEEFLDGETDTHFSVILVKILRLKQICNHQYASITSAQKKELDLPFIDSTKTENLCRIIDAIPNNEKVIIFSQYRETLFLIQESLDNNGYIDQHLIYHGGLNPQDKDTVLRTFEKDSTKRILLMSIKAGGVGLNLVSANHIVLFDLWWNRPIEEQAIARVHRIGQTREVHIHRLSILNSIEQWVIGLQEHKNELASKILDDSYDEFNITENKPNFTKEDLIKLFRATCY